MFGFGKRSGKSAVRSTKSSAVYVLRSRSSQWSDWSEWSDSARKSELPKSTVSTGRGKAVVAKRKRDEEESMSSMERDIQL